MKWVLLWQTGSPVNVPIERSGEGGVNSTLTGFDGLQSSGGSVAPLGCSAIHLVTARTSAGESPAFSCRWIPIDSTRAHAFVRPWRLGRAGLSHATERLFGRRVFDIRVREHSHATEASHVQSDVIECSARPMAGVSHPDLAVLQI